MKDYSHVVEIDRKKRRLTIYRIDANEVRELYTEVELPSTTIDEDTQALCRFAEQLGSNILLDSPAARDLLQL